MLVKIRYWIPLLALFLTWLLSCSQYDQDDPVIAQVGEKSITLETFKNAYIPILLYSDKEENLASREEVLSFLIDQNLLAAEAERLDLDTVASLKVLTRAASKTAFTRLLYAEDVRAQSPVPSDSALREAFRRSRTQRLVRHLFTPDSLDALHLYSALLAGENWDSLAALTFNEPSLAASGGVLGWMKFGDMDEVFEAAAYALPVHDVSKPVQTRFGWHIIRVDAEQRERLLTEYDFQMARPGLARTLRQRQEQSVSDQIINALMKQADLQFNPEIAPIVWDAMHRQIHVLLDNSQVEETPALEMILFEKGLEPYLEDPMLSFSGKSWTVAEFLSKVPEMNRQLMLSDLKKATAFLVRDEIIYDEGLRRAWNKRPDVKQEVEARRDQFMANLYLRYQASQHELSASAVTKFYREHASSRYLSPDSLLLEEWIVPNMRDAELLLAAAQNPADMEAIGKQANYTTRSLGWVRGALPDKPALYHRLVNLPLNTFTGPYESDGQVSLVRAVKRIRHAYPLSAVKHRVENDAYDEWVNRLRLSEVQRLRNQTKITIDRDALIDLQVSE